MPKVKTRLQKRQDNTRNLIRNSMRNMGITQSQMAKRLGKGQASFSLNIKNLNFTYSEFLVLAEELGWDDKEKAQLLTL